MYNSHCLFIVTVFNHQDKLLVHVKSFLVINLFLILILIIIFSINLEVNQKSVAAHGS